ncbi:MAG: serine/threonine-protein kinase [Verrucomicrobiota bacterium]
MDAVRSSIQEEIQVSFFSYIDQQLYPLEIHWTSASIKGVIIGHDPKSDIVLNASSIPFRWMELKWDEADRRVDFTIISRPCLLSEQGEEIQEGAFYMPQTLVFQDFGELRFLKRSSTISAGSKSPTENAIGESQKQNPPAGLIKDRYRIIRILGEGGFSHVALAQDEISGLQVAIKVIHHKVSEDQDLMEKIVDRFFQEMKILMQLNHENVTKILDYGFDQVSWSPFYVMEYVDGKSLIHFSSQFGGEERWEVADKLLEQFLEGLGYLHDRGIIHRDLKPENVLVSGSYPALKLKILDLGLAKMLNIKSYEYRLTDTKERETFGTPPYMSPEQCLNAKEVSPSSDVYSAGILICMLYSNQYPYEVHENQSYEQIHVGSPPSLKRLSQLMPSPILKLVSKSLEKKPELRLKNAREMSSFWKKQETNRFFELLGIQSKAIQKEWLGYLSLLILVLVGGVLLFLYAYGYAQLKGWIR